MIMPIYLFDNSYFNIVTITFTALILTEYLNIISEVIFKIIYYYFLFEVKYMSYSNDNMLIFIFNYLYFLHSFFKIIIKCFMYKYRFYLESYCYYIVKLAAIAFILIYKRKNLSK